MTTTDEATTDGGGTASERTMRRVAELLQRAENFRSHGEDGSADAALALAEKIMLKYAIDASVVAARVAASGSVVEDKIVVAIIPFIGIYRKALVIQFAQLVKQYTSTVRAFLSRDERIENVHVVGYKAEVDQLSMLITSIHLQAIGRMRKWWYDELPDDRRESGMPGYKARRQYLASFIQGATDRIAVARRSAVAEASASDAGTALALRSREDEVAAFLAANFSLNPVRSNLKPGSGEAAAAGYRDGQQANTGERPIRSDRLQLGT